MECGAVNTQTNEPTPEEVIYYLSIQRKCNGECGVGHTRAIEQKIVWVDRQ